MHKGLVNHIIEKLNAQGTGLTLGCEDGWDPALPSGFAGKRQALTPRTLARGCHHGIGHEHMQHRGPIPGRRPSGQLRGWAPVSLNPLKQGEQPTHPLPPIIWSQMNKHHPPFSEKLSLLQIVFHHFNLQQAVGDSYFGANICTSQW